MKKLKATFIDVWQCTICNNICYVGHTESPSIVMIFHCSQALGWTYNTLFNAIVATLSYVMEHTVCDTYDRNLEDSWHRNPCHVLCDCSYHEFLSQALYMRRWLLNLSWGRALTAFVRMDWVSQEPKQEKKWNNASPITSQSKCSSKGGNICCKYATKCGREQQMTRMHNEHCVWLTLKEMLCQ